MSGEQAHIELWPSVAWAMPADVDVDAIAQAGQQAAFKRIADDMEAAGYPVTGDVTPETWHGLAVAFQTFVRMMALNNVTIAALQDAGEDDDGVKVTRVEAVAFRHKVPGEGIGGCEWDVEPGKALERVQAIADADTEVSPVRLFDVPGLELPLNERTRDLVTDAIDTAFWEDFHGEYGEEVTALEGWAD